MLGRESGTREKKIKIFILFYFILLRRVDEVFVNDLNKNDDEILVLFMN